MTRVPESPRLSSVLGEAAVVIGNVSGHGDLEIRGKVQGDVLLEGRAFVAQGGLVLGRVEAVTVLVAGQVRGDLFASEGVEIEATGDVEGNISAPRVAILGGARVRGALHAGDTSEDARLAETPPEAPVEPPARAAAPELPAAVRPRPTHDAEEERASEPRSVAESRAVAESRPESDARAARPEPRPPTPSLRRGLPLPTAKVVTEASPARPGPAPQSPAPQTHSPKGPASAAAAPKKAGPPKIPTFRSGARASLKDAD